MSNRIAGLSAVIIAKNEAKRIGASIASVSFADEIVIVDNGSDDGTASVAKEHGATVVASNTSDFSELRNMVLNRIHGSWVLYIDADEILSDTLAKEILRIIRSKTDPGHAAYELFRKNRYLGHPWPGGEWMLRLFRKEKLVRWHGRLHESPEVDGSVGRLTGEISHDSHRTLEEMVHKTNEWSGTEAQLRMEAHHPPVTWWRFLRVMVTGFYQSYIRQGGWRAGVVGWIEGIYQAFSMFVTYAKLWELQEKGHRK